MQIPKLSTEERRVMCHALGLEVQYRKTSAYRNRFVCASTDPVWTSLVERGLASARKFTLDEVNDTTCFHVTDAGCVALVGMTLEVAEEFKFDRKRIEKALGKEIANADAI